MDIQDRIILLKSVPTENPPSGYVYQYVDPANGAVELRFDDGTVKRVSGSSMVEQWELSADNTAGGDITSNLQKRTESYIADIGDSMSESNGVFTFPFTGNFKISFDAGFRRDEADGNANSVINRIQVSTDGGSNFSTAEFGQTEIIVDASSFSWFQYTPISFTMAVKDVSTDKVKFNIDLDGASRLLSSNTSFKFKKVGDI